MSAEQGITVKGRISRRYGVEITVTTTGMFCEWTPAPPDKLTNKEMRRYRAIRDKAIAELSEKIGAGVAVVELAGGFGPDQSGA